MFVTGLSPFCKSIVIIGISLSIAFCLIVLIALCRYSKETNINKQYKTLLFITCISGISCLTTLIFILDWQKWNVQYKVQSIIVETIYLSQSLVPFLTICQSILLFGVFAPNNSYNTPKLQHVPTSDTVGFDQPVPEENKKTKTYARIYAIFSLISLCFIVLSYYTKSYLIRYSLISLPYILLEFYFITVGFKIYYTPHLYQLPLPIIPYILIRPVIVGLTVPIVVTMNIDGRGSVNYCAAYMSFSIIIISILAVLTMVLPSICVKNKRKTAMDDLPLQPHASFQSLHSHTFSKSDIRQMKIIIQNYDQVIPDDDDEKINDTKQKINDTKQKINDTKQKINEKIARVPTDSLYETRHLRRGITDLDYPFHNPSIFSTSKPSNSNLFAGAVSITVPTRNRGNTPDYSKKMSKTESKSNAKSKTFQSSTQGSSTNLTVESTKHSHFYREDTNEVLDLGSELNEEGQV